MQLVQSIPFQPAEFEGYETRRHQNDRSFGARIGDSLCYRFAVREEVAASLATESVFLRALSQHREKADRRPARRSKRRRVSQLTEGRFTLSNGQFICRDCGREFRSEQGVRTHVYMQHVLETETEEPAVCDICRRSFPQQRALQEHRTVVHLIGTPKRDKDSSSSRAGLESIYSCSICCLEFPGTEELQRHLEGITPIEVRREVICPDCGRSFHENRALEQHKGLVHHSDGLMPSNSESTWSAS